ncbi:MAG TPA: divergent polysaccharide deacetylase family protein [Devosia sp.]|nr:divergent polysaccharide deacetylase family protein [Devosia sp.]
MSDDLGAPLGRRPKKAAAPAIFKLSSGGRLPLARIAFGLVAVIVIGVGARIALVHDPMGGQPVAEIAVNSPRNANAIAALAGSSAPASMATITALPDAAAAAATAAGASITKVGADVPDGTPDASIPGANAQGLFPDLLEPADHGAIPRISAAGQTPFDAYSRPSVTPDTAAGKPLIAIVVTGLGINDTGTDAAVQQLPDAVTLAFAPYGKSLARDVAAARANGHEILLEVPLEPFDYPQSDPGPDTLLTGQAPRDNLDKLYTVMGKFGGYVGLINYMGARFTASATDFGPVMEELGTRGLGYVDDGSSNRSVAAQLATAHNVEFGHADLSLDDDPARGPIQQQLTALEAKATQAGGAIGVISALPVSVQAVADWAKTAADRGFTIVPVSALMKKPG